YAFGMGELEPAIVAGEPAPNPAPQLPNAPCAAFFEQADRAPLASAPSVWAGAASGVIGVYRVDLEISTSVKPRSYTLSLTDRYLTDSNGSGRACKIGYQGDVLDSVMVEVQ